MWWFHGLELVHKKPPPGVLVTLHVAPGVGVVPHAAPLWVICGPELAGSKLPIRVWLPELVTRSQLPGCQRSLLKDERPRIHAERGRRSTEEQERDAPSSAVPALTLQSLPSQSLKPHPPIKEKWLWGSAQVLQRTAKCRCRIN